MRRKTASAWFLLPPSASLTNDAHRLLLRGRGQAAGRLPPWPTGGRRPAACPRPRSRSRCASLVREAEGGRRNHALAVFLPIPHAFSARFIRKLLRSATGRPVEPLSLPDFHAVPAMSRCAQSNFLAK